MTGAERLASLIALRGHPLDIRLPLADVHRAEAFLRDVCGIGLWKEGDLLDWLCETAPRELCEQIMEIYVARSDGSKTPEEDRLFYDLVGDHRVAGKIHSVRRPEILDLTVLLSFVIKRLGLRGPVLDIGCHTGHHAHWMAAEHGMVVQGIDVAEQAIAVAQRRSAQHGLPASFAVSDWRSFTPDQQYEMICCLAISSHSFPSGLPFRRLVSESLVDGGVVVMCFGKLSDEVEDDLRRMARSAGLAYGVADVIGGWNGASFGACAVVVLVKAKGQSIPYHFERVATEGWTRYFGASAARAEMLRRDLTQSVYRATIAEREAAG